MTPKTLLRLLIFFIGLTSTFFSNFVLGSQQNILEQVQQTAEQFVTALIDPPDNGELHVQASPLDSRLRLSPCPTELEATVPGKQSLTGNVTVLVKCPAADWQVYVPVKTQLMLPRVVATKPLGRGMVITTDDLTIQMVDLRFQRGMIFERPAQIIGSKMKRNVKMGDTIQGNDICLVCRNDTVRINAGGSNLSIITEGVALSDGSLGEQVRVQNARSKKIINASVTAVGEVSVSY
ncbi:flagella basal body P-ring formation protein FlgA [Photobacterium ganghwense]|uniref:Flagella basal body P-ring formation protein FlgA n=1 Tax=Photobacterium ganghwense TaxID=320778 RepID=A0A0J1HHE3_9GAMM|nr:flagellar basal body P-ring formation chaperone FlgA [Photobacterium ganghwense]KLV11028.1 flagellar basal body P-ring biosynthesis protein FlgA [Photobacterium ganghwense]PSU11290.1 flagella basal body P-ring formation protein FlgA [Photobacterium ganghwense]QSV13409.1 flagellar basal body P-ring formation protein FlgA [Photobacterium ganghwense]